MNDIPIIKWGKNWPVSKFFDRLVVWLFLWRYTKIQGWSSIDVHATQAHGMPLIAHMPWPSFVSKRKWWFLLNLLLPWGFGCGTQNGNSGNWFVSRYIFTSLCETSELSWTCYSLSIHFLLLDIILCFTCQWHHVYDAP